jgi:hypothetical protein
MCIDANARIQCPCRILLNSLCHDHMAWGVRHWQGLLKGGVAISRIVQITHPTHYLSIAAPLRLSLLLRMQELP